MNGVLPSVRQVARCEGRTATKKIRVVLAEGHALVRQGIRRFLEENRDSTVVTEASDGERALELVAKHQPDISVIDIRMPKLSGVDLAQRIKTKYLKVKILVLTAYDDDPYIFALLQAGADGYILKTADSSRLVEAVHQVAKGEPALDLRVAKKLVEQLTSPRLGLRNNEVLERPTERELEVLRLAGRSLTNQAIEQELGISHLQCGEGGQSACEVESGG